MASGPKVRTRGKRKPTKRPTSKKYQAFTIEGNTLSRNKSMCAKCGAGVYMAQHKNRETCGKCGYTKFKQD
ncbi:30S ribosomal protein S27ae [archaeon CG10_big_fil_rev_8_21_14_0_10_43_11]|nr:MAG: 30S ribosomal protein S27ae [archaeon CG10_big_fil_rev_8_21_14_0_10_43_11]